MLSARAGEEAIVEGLEAGADDYLVKPFSARELIAHVRTQLETSRVRQEAARPREDFVSIASHELKTPLTTIKGNVQLLARVLNQESIDRDRAARIGNQLQIEVNRLQILVNDLLDAARIQRGALELRIERLDLAELAGQVVEQFLDAPEYTDQHTLTLEAPAPVIGMWDPIQLNQALTNLISNALKYSPNGGDVRVVVYQLGEQAEVVIKDHGIGLSSAEQSVIFQPFVRGDALRQRTSGTGLGLHITAQIVQRHDGTISVESEPGHGSSFRIRLPLAGPSITSSSDRALNATAAP